MPINFKIADNKSDFARCVYIRAIVFGAGQGIPLVRDIDELESECHHILGLDGDIPCATARWRLYEPGTAKIERVAVLDDYQGKGIGKALMAFLVDDIRKNHPDIQKLILGSEDHAIPFYERLGFATVGEGFMDANIPHHWMERAA